MLQQLEQCAVRKAFKVTQVNCTDLRAEENVCKKQRGMIQTTRECQIHKFERKDIISNYKWT